MENKKQLILLGLFILIISISFLLKPIVFSTDRGEKIYKQGLEFYNEGDFQNAYYNFKKVPRYTPISSPALYRQAYCAHSLGDDKIAVKKYVKFAKIIRDKDITPLILWRLGLLYVSIGDDKKAFKTFENLHSKYPQSNFSKAASYQLAILHGSKDKELAARLLVEYINYAPMGRYSLEAINILENYTNVELSDKDKLYMAIALFDNGLYAKSLNYLSQVPFIFAWPYTARNYEKLADNQKAADTILKGLGDKKLLSEKEILDLMTLYIKTSGLSNKEAVIKMYKASLDSENNILAKFFYSKYLNPPAALENYEYIYTKHSASVVAPDALWEAFWHLYKSANYKEALRVSKLQKNVYSDGIVQPKILYWSAKILMKHNQAKQARVLYNDIVKQYPDSYYAYRSYMQLKGSKNPWSTQRGLKIEKTYDIFPLPLDNDTKGNRLIKRFANLGDYNAIEDFKIEDEYLKSWLAAIKGKKAYSIMLARNEFKTKDLKISSSDPAYKLMYPIYYENLINSYALNENNLNPYLILALVREESFFDNNAQSVVGARGLMQIMPATANMMAGYDVSLEQLEIPSVNIMLGTKYFSHLMKEFSGNEMLCVLAYNAGPGAVKRWFAKQGLNPDMDEFIEDVPYSETQNYVKKIYASYWNYLRVYKDKL